jgi:2'-phosphotransferase
MIFINVPKAMAAGYVFYKSINGAVLTEGDERGFIPPEFFERVEFGTKSERPERAERGKPRDYPKDKGIQ